MPTYVEDHVAFLDDSVKAAPVTHKPFSTFNKKAVDATTQPMFFGECINVARFDRRKYEIFEKLSEKQLSYFWRPEEVDVTGDRKDFANLDPHEQHIFISNLKYQILLDSVQGRSPTIAFLPVCSLPELENWLENWSYSETVHSRSYTHIVRNVFNDPSAVLDEIMVTPEIIKRATAVTEEYDRFIELVNIYSVVGSFGQHTVAGITYDCSERNMKYHLARAMVSVYALEAIRFYVSFACSFAFAERGVMEGNAKIVRFICRDELLHKTGTKQILNLLIGSRENDPVMQEIFKTHQAEFKQILVDCKDQESEWIEYLFKDGSMIGLNARILNEYLEWVADEASDNLGWGPIVGHLKSNPLPWMRSWVTSDAVQPAPQETELSSYLVGQIDSSVDVGSLGNFDDGFDF
jgi:ribonucleoside-diphosphate reductase beta chain